MTLLSRLRIRSRLLLGVLIPVVITAATLAWITVAQIKSGGEAELERLEASLLEARKEGVKNLVDTARSLVLNAKNNPDLRIAKRRRKHGSVCVQSGTRAETMFSHMLATWKIWPTPPTLLAKAPQPIQTCRNWFGHCSMRPRMVV